MCVVIIDGKNRDFFIELGVDPEAAESLSTIDLTDTEVVRFIMDNTGSNKTFPSGPTCVFKEKEVPCFVRFNEGGGINGQILKEMFQTLDALSIFKDCRDKGMKPFVLLDGHQSMFNLQFMQYINDEQHPWC